MRSNHLKIIGCGGHCKVVLDALSLINQELNISLYDNSPHLLGKKVNGILVESYIDSLEKFVGLIHVAIGNNPVREKIINHVNLELFTIIHPASVISSSSHIDFGSFIAAKAIVGPESYVGKSCIINHGAIVDHEVRIGDYSHIAPNSTIGGNVTVGNSVLIGAGAVILPGLNIGDNAIVGAGAVVVEDVQSNSIVKGVPAVSKGIK